MKTRFLYYLRREMSMTLTVDPLRLGGPYAVRALFMSKRRVVSVDDGFTGRSPEVTREISGV